MRDRCDRPARPNAPAAFTLIELLVVISVIALLISILLPVVGSARDNARAIHCLSNMRQLAIATRMYADEHHSTYPQPSQDGEISNTSQRGSALWFNAVDHYVNAVPLDYSTTAADRNYNPYKQDPVWGSFPEAGNVRRDNRTIKMNQFFGKASASYPGESLRWTRDAQLMRASETVLYFDGRAYDTPSVTTGNIDTGGGGLFGAAEVYAGLRHSGGANVTFADAHARHHRDDIRQSPTGYQGWFAGTLDTNGFLGGGAAHGPHQLFWRIDRY